MKTLQSHEAEAVVQADQSIRITHLPFNAGERVRVLVTDERVSDAHCHTPDQIAKSRTIRQGLRGSVLQYDRPTDPVGVEDWEILR